MNEMDILDYFYDKLRQEGKTRDTLYLSLDESAAQELQQKLGTEIKLSELHRYADICIANEWLERTTADPAYNYLSLTEAGLVLAVAFQYSTRQRG